ncbi:hypothetical protein ALC57_16881 [Trachymyrmex cornetzi]|uniref:Uncharacterized protein n=1 Tax=Trachymyrmex cornetzi TaxID=471704 RepID=A0A151IUK3_9HYME|nr:hypothetical protein ALC57_16881 [Trachymyrmex cornetzi]
MYVYVDIRNAREKKCAKTVQKGNAKFLREAAVNGFRGKTIKNARLLAPSKKLIPIALIMGGSEKKLVGAEEAIIAVAFPATGMDGSERLYRAVLASWFENAFHRHFQRPTPASPDLFYCGRVPVSEHPAKSNIRGAAIIDKNGCLVAEPAYANFPRHDDERFPRPRPLIKPDATRRRKRERSLKSRPGFAAGFRRSNFGGVAPHISPGDSNTDEYPTPLRKYLKPDRAKSSENGGIGNLRFGGISVIQTVLYISLKSLPTCQCQTIVPPSRKSGERCARYFSTVTSDRSS